MRKIITLRASSWSFSYDATTCDGDLRLYRLEVFCISVFRNLFRAFFFTDKLLHKTFYTLHPYTSPTFIFRNIQHYYYIYTHDNQSRRKEDKEIFHIDSSYKQQYQTTGEQDTCCRKVLWKYQTYYSQNRQHQRDKRTLETLDVILSYRKFSREISYQGYLGKVATLERDSEYIYHTLCIVKVSTKT